MAITLTLEQLTDHLRVDRDAVNSGDPRRTILVELMQAGTERVELYAPDAPKDTQNLALSRVCGYWYDAPATGLNNSPQVDAFRISGAMALLAPFRNPFATLAPSGGGGTTDPAETDLGPSTPVVPPATRYFAVKATNDFTGADFLAGEEFDENGEAVIPIFPVGVFQAYFGFAIELGKTITQIAFDPDGYIQIVTPRFSAQADIVIASEPYTPWLENTRYYSTTEGFVVRITVEDI